MHLTHKQFTLEAPQQRVWALLWKAVYRCLPLEKMDIVNELTFRAVLRWRLASISLPLNVKVALIDISPPSFFGSVIHVKKGVLGMDMKVTFTLSPVNNGKTEVVCTATQEGGGTITGCLLRGRQQRFTEEVFDSIKTRVKQLC